VRPSLVDRQRRRRTAEVVVPITPIDHPQEAAMPQSTFEKFLPASGILAGILFAVGGYISHTPDSSSQNPITVMSGHEAQNMVAVIAGALFAVTMAFFAVGIRQALRSGESGESTYSSAAFAGGIMVAVLTTLNTWLLFATVDAVDDKDRAAAHLFGLLGINAWLPLMIGAAVLLLSTGLGGLRTAVLPKWLSIVTIVLGVCCFGGPTGFLVWFALPVWCIAVGVVLVRRQQAAAPAAAVTQTVHA
jgi:hypothetical protein